MSAAIIITNLLKYWKYIVVALIAAASFSAGMKHSSDRFEAVESKRLNAQIAVMTEEMKKASVESVRQLTIANKSVIALSSKLDEESGRSRVITKEIIKYVKSDSGCNLSNGAVRLLNDARNNDSGVSDVPGATRLSDEEEHDSSSITQLNEINGHLQCVSEYNRLSARNNALVDWWGSQKSTKQKDK